MKPTRVLRIFADHYQFFIYDAGENPFNPSLEYSDETVARGWTRTEHTISFATQAHLNDHRLDVFLGAPPSPLKADRVTIHPLQVASGSLALHDTEETILAQVTPGTYALVLAGYHLGQEQSSSDEDLSDDQFLSCLEWERYELYLFKPQQPVADGLYLDAG
jgi:hypothetical protein